VEREDDSSRILRVFNDNLNTLKLIYSCGVVSQYPNDA
jgi:hypothetical protein